MAGILSALLGASGATRFQLAVGAYYGAFKGAYWNYYGFGTASGYYAMGGLLSPATFKGQTVQAIYSVEDNTGGTWPVAVELPGDIPAGFVKAVTMGGTRYALATYAQGYKTSAAVTINIATATFTVSSTSGITTGTPVQFTTGGALPTGLTASTKYYARDLTATTFKVSATIGGAAITLSGTQSGTHTAYWNIYTTFSVATGTASNKTGGRVPFYPAISIAAPAVVTSTGHGLINGERVIFQTTGTLPTGITANTVYFVVNAAADTFQISATSGGAALPTSGSQSGTHTCLEVVDVTVE
jgi:hypothetical protein